MPTRGFQERGPVYLPGEGEKAALAGAITMVPGIGAGHYTNPEAATGCTVVLCQEGAVAGVDVRGGAPGTRETDLMGPGNLVDRVHGVLLSGGSAFGLDAASGVMRFLEERGAGFRVGNATVPIVPAAILYDLGLITHTLRPGPDEGYSACLASSSGPLEEGSVGAGTGATVGKALGMERAVKGGVGTASVELPDGAVVGAVVAVNAYGGVVDHDTGDLVAGPRIAGDQGFHDTVDLLLRGLAGGGEPGGANTTIGVVATDAQLSKDQAHYLARVAHDGLALAIRPSHTIRDGDTLFALATRKGPAATDLTALGAAATLVVALSVVRAVRQARGLGGVPAVRELEIE